MNDSVVEYRKSRYEITANRKALVSGETRDGSVVCDLLQPISLETVDDRVARLTKTRSAFYKSIQHRLQFRRRTTDHTQDFARRALLLFSLRES